MKQSRTIRVADIEFVFSVETLDNVNPQLNIEMIPVADMADTTLLRLVVEAPDYQTFALRDLTVEWAIPVSDMHGLYFGGNPMAELAYLPFWHTQKSVCANTGVPYIALIHRNGENRAAFGSFDQITETTIIAELSEITCCYHFRLQKPANKDSAGQTIPVTKRREEILFVSKAQQPWPEVLQDYVRLCDDRMQPVKMPVPDCAFDPVFCTWTAIHHDVSHDWILRHARLAADLGFRTWITDDGWFIEKGRFADYSLVGDWLPGTKKFPDFKAHVQAVQALGFRYLLWVAPFMVGYESQAAHRNAHLLIKGQERERFHNLSPRHAETRQVVTNLLEHLIQEYQLDGLKIDFLDSLSAHSERRKGASEDTFGSSFYHLLHDIVQRLLVVRPDLLIEFRNSYTNLASRSYANLYRSSDVPINFSLNRWQAVMLRLLTPDRAVVMDPALWHPSESDVNVAVHLINLIVSVPMVSVELERYPQTHLDLIRYWIGFYNAHRETIIHGVFKPVLRSGHIPVIYFVGRQETIIGVYDDVPVSLESNGAAVWLLNASTQPCVDFLPSDFDGGHQVVIRDKFGAVITEQAVRFPLSRLSVEVGGSIEIKPVIG